VSDRALQVSDRALQVSDRLFSFEPYLVPPQEVALPSAPGCSSRH
jgi:hypothetical protein